MDSTIALRSLPTVAFRAGALRTLRWLSWLPIMVVVAWAVHHRLSAMPTGAGWMDAYVYFDAVGHLMSVPSHVYDDAMRQMSLSTAQRAYIYPPAGLLPFLPLEPIRTHLGLAAAAACWVIIDTACLITAVGLLCRRLELSWPVSRLASLVVMSSGPALAEVGSGQVNGLLLLLCALAWCSRSPLRGGALTGLAVAIKPVAPLLLLLPLLRHGQRRSGLVAALTAVLVNVPVALSIGPAATSSYLFRFLPFLATNVTHDVDNLAPANLLRVWVGGDPFSPRDAGGTSALHAGMLASALGWVLRGVVLVLWVRRVRRRDCDDLEAGALTLAMVPVLGATVWPHYELLAAPLALLLLRRCRNWWARAGWAAAVIGLVDDGRPGGLWLDDPMRASLTQLDWIRFLHGQLLVAVLIVVVVRGLWPRPAPALTEQGVPTPAAWAEAA